MRLKSPGSGVCLSGLTTQCHGTMFSVEGLEINPFSHLAQLLEDAHISLVDASPPTSKLAAQHLQLCFSLGPLLLSSSLLSHLHVSEGSPMQSISASSVPSSQSYLQSASCLHAATWPQVPEIRTVAS